MEELEWRNLDYQEIGRRIRVARELMRMSREELAERIDVSNQFIADIEYGHKGMSIKTLYALCQVLDVSADYILAGKVSQQVACGEMSRIKEEISMVLDRCNGEQLQGVCDIIKIYEVGTRLK